MVAIIDYGKELAFQPARSIEWIKNMKKRVLPHCDFVIHDSAFLCPIKLDNAAGVLSEEEVIEFLHSEAYPKLIAEGRMALKNGKPVRRKENDTRNRAIVQPGSS